MILDKQIAVVTGAGSDIGRASASILAREGATVIVTDLQSKSAAETARQINSMGFRASWVDTPFNAPFMKQMGGRDSLERYVQNQIPMRLWASTEEIAEAVLFMASARSSFMTGQALVVEGGESLAGGG